MADAAGCHDRHRGRVTGPSAPVRVLVVDSDRRVRQSLAGLIRLSDGLDLTGVAADPVAAVELLERDRTDVLLIDPRLPEAEMGLALLTELHRRWPAIAIVAMSGLDGVEISAIGSGALAFVSKSARPELLVDTLQSCGRAARDKASLQGALDDGVHADG
jgi:DNA-binding NarL/FixJ family response regulator